MHGLDTFIAKYFILIPIITTVGVWFKLDTQRKRQFIVFVVLAAIGSVILAKLGSHLHNDPRPFVTGHFKPYFSHGNDNGFPSDHTLFASLLAFTVWRYSRTIGYWLLATAVLIGMSRVFAGVHHLQDIVGAIVFAAIGTWAAWWLVNHYLPAENTHPNRPRRRPKASPGDQ